MVEGKGIKARPQMIFLRKLAPGRLARAIVTLTARTGNRIARTVQARRTANADQREALVADRDFDSPRSYRTTITVETERLLVLRSQRSSSSFRTERDPD